MYSRLFSISAIAGLLATALAFAPASVQNYKSSFLLASPDNIDSSDVQTSSTRRTFFNTISTAALLTTASLTTTSSPAFAEEEEEEKKSVQTPLYFILRVREATEQEARLIKSGKFKDVQRANVKLAVKFMVDNYRLNDNFIAASAFLTGDKRIKAGDAGQNVVQNLYTILEYFDSSDVENIKVSDEIRVGVGMIIHRE